jgi:hypothetical protein
LPDLKWSETIDVQRVRLVEHDMRDWKHPVGIFHVTSKETGLRAFYWSEVERVIGSLGTTEPRKTALEIEAEEKAERKAERMAERERRIEERKARKRPRGTRRKPG